MPSDSEDENDEDLFGEKDVASTLLVNDAGTEFSSGASSASAAISGIGGRSRCTQVPRTGSNSRTFESIRLAWFAFSSVNCFWKRQKALTWRCTRFDFPRTVFEFTDVRINSPSLICFFICYLFLNTQNTYMKMHKVRFLPYGFEMTDVRINSLYLICFL